MGHFFQRPMVISVANLREIFPPMLNPHSHRLTKVNASLSNFQTICTASDTNLPISPSSSSVTEAMKDLQLRVLLQICLDFVESKVDNLLQFYPFINSQLTVNVFCKVIYNLFHIFSIKVRLPQPSREACGLFPYNYFMIINVVSLCVNHLH